ncbi:unnamed protein product [Gadus morhua 'NCC']
MDRHKEPMFGSGGRGRGGGLYHVTSHGPLNPWTRVSELAGARSGAHDTFILSLERKRLDFDNCDPTERRYEGIRVFVIRRPVVS